MKGAKLILEEQLQWASVDGFQKAISKQLVGNNETSGFSVFIEQIETEGRVPVHSHEEESFYYILEGEAMISLGDKTFHGCLRCAVYVPSWFDHGITNSGSSTLKYIEFKI